MYRHIISTWNLKGIKKIKWNKKINAIIYKSLK